MVSLSRFQLVIWTLIIISGFLIIALSRIKAGSTDPLNIALPTQIWETLGISVAALVGSPLILSTKTLKTSKKFKDDNRAKIRAALTANESPPEPIFGILAVNDSKKGEKPKFSDMFTGDEEGNKNSVDLAKVQMFFFTIIIAISYVILFYNLIISPTIADALKTNLTFNFPALTDSTVALLGISSAGYLANKTYDKTKQ